MSDATHAHSAHMAATHMSTTATTTRFRVGCEKAASKRCGYQNDHCPFQHVSPLFLRRIGLRVKLTLRPLRPAVTF
jgi:hypothetical protein